MHVVVLTRPADSLGEWWNLAELLEPGSSSPDQRSYHAAASLAADGLGNSSCVYVYSGRDYAGGLQFDDLWRLCPTGGYLGTYSDTTFRWTELTPTGNSPKGRQASYVRSVGARPWYSLPISYARGAVQFFTSAIRGMEQNLYLTCHHFHGTFPLNNMRPITGSFKSDTMSSPELHPESVRKCPPSIDVSTGAYPSRG